MENVTVLLYTIFYRNNAIEILFLIIFPKMVFASHQIGDML